MIYIATIEDFIYRIAEKIYFLTSLEYLQLSL